MLIQGMAILVLVLRLKLWGDSQRNNLSSAHRSAVT